MLYEPKFETEVRELIRVVKSKVNEKAYVHDLKNTKALSRFYLFTIFDLVEGAFGAIRNRSLNTSHIIGRSLIEYYIDLVFVILKDDREVNRLFDNYHKLQLYWMIPHMSMVHLIPRVEREFKNYVELRFANELEKCARKASKGQTDKWAEVSAVLRRNKGFGSHWSGVNFYNRVEYCKAEYLRRTNKEADYPIKRIMLYYQMYSQYTHPSPFSIAPNFKGIDGSFFDEREYSNDNFEDAEHFFFLIVDYSAELFAEVMDAPVGEQLKALIEKTVKSSRKLSDYLYDQK